MLPRTDTLPQNINFFNKKRQYSSDDHGQLDKCVHHHLRKEARGCGAPAEELTQGMMMRAWMRVTMYVVYVDLT